MNRLFQSRIAQRFWAIAGSASIRVKVLGIVLGIVLILSAFVIVQMRSVLTERLLRDLEVQGLAIAEGIAHHAAELLAQGEQEALQLYLADRLAHYSNESHNTSVAYLVVRDAATDSPIESVGRADAAPDLSSGTEVPFAQEGVSFQIGDEILQITIAMPEVEAVLSLGLAQHEIERTVQSVTLQLLSITAVMVAVGFAAAFFLTWILTRPLLELVDATHAVARGDFSRRVPRWANDEIGALATAFNQMTASLQRAEEERTEREALRRRYVSGVIRAQENERQRIARELHDSASQSLTSLLVGLQSLKVTAGDPALTQHIDDLRSVVGQTLDEVRFLAWRLRPSALDDLGLVSALRNYIDDYQKRYDIHVDYVASGIEDRLPPEMETSVYRIVQEGLTNVARYAQASRASVILSRRNGVVRLIIEDNGVGFDPAQVQRKRQSLGLQGIRERAALLGGTLTIESQPGQGTSLFVELPLATEQDFIDHV